MGVAQKAVYMNMRRLEKVDSIRGSNGTLVKLHATQSFGCISVDDF